MHDCPSIGNEIFKPRHMRKGYSSSFRCVCVCVYLSLAKLAATYLVCLSKVRWYKVPYGVPNTCILWISLKTLCLPVLVSFADSNMAHVILLHTGITQSWYPRL